MRGERPRMGKPDRQAPLIGRLVGRLLDPGDKLLHRKPGTQRGRLAHQFTPKNRVPLLYGCCQTGISWPVEVVIAKINPILRGWVNYFRVGHSSICFGVVKRWVEEKVRRHLMRARGRKGFGWTRWSSEWLYDRLGLFNNYQLRRWSGAKVALAR